MRTGIPKLVNLETRRIRGVSPYFCVLVGSVNFVIEQGPNEYNLLTVTDGGYYYKEALEQKQ